MTWGFPASEKKRLDAVSLANGRVRTLAVPGAGVYVPPNDVREFWVFIAGSIGGAAESGGLGGAGYSEKFYAQGSFVPGATAYNYTVGAPGVEFHGTDGGDTTFGVMTVSGGKGTGYLAGAGQTGSAGGVGVGGDFNATGGHGSNGNAIGYSGGGGGGAGRAGDGGDAGASIAGNRGGAGGGTGGNNGGGLVGGAAGVLDVLALTLPFKQFSETFQRGGDVSTPQGGAGASGFDTFDVNVGITPGAPGGYSFYNGAGGGIDGQPGVITILEIL